MPTKRQLCELLNDDTLEGFASPITSLKFENPYIIISSGHTEEFDTITRQYIKPSENMYMNPFTRQMFTIHETCPNQALAKAIVEWNKNLGLDDQVPPFLQAFICPLTGVLMTDPIFYTVDGINWETCENSPSVTEKATTYGPNRALGDAITAYRKVLDEFAEKQTPDKDKTSSDKHVQFNLTPPISSEDFLRIYKNKFTPYLFNFFKNLIALIIDKLKYSINLTGLGQDYLLQQQEAIGENWVDIPTARCFFVCCTAPNVKHLCFMIDTGKLQNTDARNPNVDSCMSFSIELDPTQKETNIKSVSLGKDIIKKIFFESALPHQSVIFPQFSKVLCSKIQEKKGTYFNFNFTDLPESPSIVSIPPNGNFKIYLSRSLKRPNVSIFLKVKEGVVGPNAILRISRNIIPLPTSLPHLFSNPSVPTDDITKQKDPNPKSPTSQ